MSAQSLPAALSGLTVLDLTHEAAGPYCTKLLAGFGAEVIKVERPGSGDRMRATGPFYKDEEGPERSIPFLWLNTGKKSVTLDLKSRKGRGIMKDLVKGADLLIESFSPRVMPSLGLGYEELETINPGLVMTSISNFGRTGPHRDFEAEEITVYAMAGAMSLTGSAQREPLAPGIRVSQYSAALWAYFGTLVALYQRKETGKGQHLDVSIQECAVDNIEIALANCIHMGTRARRSKHMMVPWDLYACLDGYAAVLCGPFRHWLKGAEIFEEPRLLEPQYRHVRDRHERRGEVEDLIQPWISRHTRQEIFEAGQGRGLAFGYLASLKEAIDLPPHADRGFLEETAHPVAGRHRYPGAPFKLSETPWKQGSAPLLGEHTRQVLSERLGYSERDVAALCDEGVV